MSSGKRLVKIFRKASEEDIPETDIPAGGNQVDEIVYSRANQQTGPEETIYNPLHFAIGEEVTLDFEPGGVYKVVKIAVYTTRIENKDSKSVKYFLQDLTGMGEQESVVLELRETPRSPTRKIFLFSIIDEFRYDEEFANVLEDDSLALVEGTGEDESSEIYQKIAHAFSQVKMIGESRQLYGYQVDVLYYAMKREQDISYLTVEVDYANCQTTIYKGEELLESKLKVSLL